MTRALLIGGPYDGREVELLDYPPIVRVGHPMCYGLPPKTIETYRRGTLADTFTHVATERFRSVVDGAGGSE